MLRVITIGLFSLFLVSCNIQPLDLKGIDGIKIGKLSKEGVNLDVTMRVANPNNMKFKLKSADLDIYLNNTKLGKATIDKKIIIPKKSEQAYTVSIHSKFSQLLLGALPLTKLLTGKKTTKVKISGDVRVKSFWVGKTFPVEIERDLPLSKISQISK